MRKDFVPFLFGIAYSSLIVFSILLCRLSDSHESHPLPHWQAVPPPTDTAGGGRGDLTGGTPRAAHPPPPRGASGGGATPPPPPTPHQDRMVVRVPTLPRPAQRPRYSLPSPASQSRRAGHRRRASPDASVPLRCAAPLSTAPCPTLPLPASHLCPTRGPPSPVTLRRRSSPPLTLSLRSPPRPSRKHPSLPRPFSSRPTAPCPAPLRRASARRAMSRSAPPRITSPHHPAGACPAQPLSTAPQHAASD